MTAEDDFKAWYAERRDHFARAQEDLAESVARFVSDWADQFVFRAPERHDRGATKDADRAYAKCVAKGVTDFDRLLEEPAPVGDLCRTRLIFRSRSDVEAFRSAVDQVWPHGPVQIDDFTYKPSDSGYRAVHVNGWLPAQIRGVALSVPYEVQVKTVAQDAWGYYTHDSSYVPTEVNQHPRWGQVRALQQLLSDQLHVVDQLQQQIEIVGEEIGHEVGAGGDPDEVMFSNVRVAIDELYATTCSLGEAQRIVRRAREHGITSMAQFEERISPERPAAAEIRETFDATRSRPPTAIELVAELLARGD